MRAGTILLYNCSGPEFSKLRQIFAMLRLRMRPVSPEQYHLSLEELAQGKGEAGPAGEETIPEAMLVFCGLNQALLHQVLEVIRVAKLPPIPLKAVLTETNREWDSLRLHQELCKEQAAIQEQQEKKAD